MDIKLYRTREHHSNVGRDPFIVTGLQRPDDKVEFFFVGTWFVLDGQRFHEYYRPIIDRRAWN